MDTFLCIASKRDTRDYDGRPLPADAVRRILEAGRVAGSARNRQQRRFCALESAASRERAAQGVTRPSNLLGAAFAVAIVIQGSAWDRFDAARSAQNMMLAAANDGIASCPNATKDPAVLAELVELREGEELAVILSFGYPARGRHAESRPAQEWLARADRQPLDELVTRY